MKPPNKPIPTEVLKDILARRKDDPEVVALLWEIWRYRAIARRASQLSKTVVAHDDTMKMMLSVINDLLKDDPAVIEHKQMVEVLLDRSG